MTHRILVSIAGALVGGLVSTGGIAGLFAIQHAAVQVARITSLALPL